MPMYQHNLVAPSTVYSYSMYCAGVQLDVMTLWHQLIDHHHNREKIPFHMQVKESCIVQITDTLVDVQ